MNDARLRAELEQVCRDHRIDPPTYCRAQRDGDCTWAGCPQARDGEPGRTGRHCPLDIHGEERGYQ